MSRARKVAIIKAGGRMSNDPDAQSRRAMALMCAAVTWRGDPTDSEGLLGLADDFLEYMEGRAVPTPDKLQKGHIPR